MGHPDDPFEEMLHDSGHGSAADKLFCDLIQLCEARPHLAPENLDADGLVDLVER